MPQQTPARHMIVWSAAATSGSASYIVPAALQQVLRAPLTLDAGPVVRVNWVPPGDVCCQSQVGAFYQLKSSCLQRLQRLLGRPASRTAQHFNRKTWHVTYNTIENPACCELLTAVLGLPHRTSCQYLKDKSPDPCTATHVGQSLHGCLVSSTEWHSPHIWQSISQLNLSHDLFVLGVAGVVQLRGAPLVASKELARLQHPQDLLQEPKHSEAWYCCVAD